MNLAEFLELSTSQQTSDPILVGILLGILSLVFSRLLKPAKQLSLARESTWNTFSR